MKRVKEGEQSVSGCVYKCMRDKACNHVYVYVSIHAQEQQLVKSSESGVFTSCMLSLDG